MQEPPERRTASFDEDGRPRERSYRAACLAAAVAVSLALPLASAERRAYGQTPSEIATAKHWFADGLAREEKGEFSAALDLFRRAVEVKRTPQIVYHVGFCESRTGALVEALVDLDSAGSIARAAHADDVVTAAQDELADVKKRIPTLEVRDDRSAKATRFVVDGNAIALSMLRTAMPLDPGEHTVAVEYASGSSTSKSVTLAEHDVRTLELTPPAAPVATVVPPATSPAQPGTETSPAREQPRSSVVPVALTAVGAALVVGGAVFFVVARSKEGTLHDACQTRTNCDPSLSSSYDTAKTFNTLGLTLGAVGIVAAGAGVSMLVLRPSASSTTAIALAPWGIVASGRF